MVLQANSVIQKLKGRLWLEMGTFAVWNVCVRVCVCVRVQEFKHTPLLSVFDNNKGPCVNGREFNKFQLH